MLNLQQWLRLRTLNRDLRNTNQSWAKVVRDMSAAKPSPEDRMKIHQERYQEIKLLEDEIDGIHSRQLIQRARRLKLPVPAYAEDSPDWQESHMTGDVFLTDEAYTKLRREIAYERKERRENFTGWATALVAVLSLFVSLGSLAVAYRAIEQNQSVSEVPVAQD